MPLLKISPCCGCMEVKTGLKICSIAKMVFDLFGCFLIIYGVYKCAERLNTSLHNDNIELPQAIVAISISGLVFLFVGANLIVDIVLFCSVDTGSLGRMAGIFKTLVGFTVINLAFSLVLIGFAVFEVEKVGMYACSVAFVAACVAIYTLWLLSAHVKWLRMYANSRAVDANEVMAGNGGHVNPTLILYGQPQIPGGQPPVEYEIELVPWGQPPPPYTP